MKTKKLEVIEVQDTGSILPSPRELRQIEFTASLGLNMAIGIPKPNRCSEWKKREYLVRHILKTFPDLVIIKGDKSYDGYYETTKHRAEVKSTFSDNKAWVVRARNLKDLKDWFFAVFDRNSGWPIRIYRITGYCLGTFYREATKKIEAQNAKGGVNKNWASISEKALLSWFEEGDLELYDGEGNRIY